ncbi:MAG: Hint domain-containing protein [Allosphingosinicella sp.]
MSQAELTADDTALILKYRQMVDEAGGSMTHDLSDPEQLAFVKLMHNVCGNHEGDFPGLHGMLDSAEPTVVALEAGDSVDPMTIGWSTAFGIPEVGAVAESLVAAAVGYGTVVDGFQTCNLSVLVLAPDGSFLANGSTAGQAPLNSLALKTNDATAKPFVPGTTAMMTYSYKSMSGAYASGTVSGSSGGAISDPVVIEPKRENGNTTPQVPQAINIGLGRPGDQSGCDYTFDETTAPNTPIGRLPLVGNVTFGNPIKPLQPGTNFLVDIYVIRTDVGGKSMTLTPTDMNNVYNNFNIDPGNPNALQWNLPMKANTQPPPPDQPYNPVVFSNIPWSTNMLAYLTVNITVTVDDGSPNGKPVTVTIQSSDVSDSDPIDGVTYIMPVAFIWHCLGEDTQVAMADGSSRTIPEIKAGDEVMAATGGEDARVTATHNGAHFGEVYVLRTTCGKALTASAEHVIFTSEGEVAARDLRPGMKLITVDGEAELSTVEQEPGEGRNLWNLSLGQAPQIDDDDPEVGQFYANGILVGDARATQAIRYRQINDIEWVKAQVPESFHPDVESTFRLRQSVVQR